MAPLARPLKFPAPHLSGCSLLFALDRLLASIRLLTHPLVRSLCLIWPAEFGGACWRLAGAGANWLLALVCKSALANVVQSARSLRRRFAQRASKRAGRLGGKTCNLSARLAPCCPRPPLSLSLSRLATRECHSINAPACALTCASLSAATTFFSPPLSAPFRWLGHALWPPLERAAPPQRVPPVVPTAAGRQWRLSSDLELRACAREPAKISCQWAS